MTTSPPLIQLNLLTLTSSAADSPASPSASPEGAGEQTTPGGSGRPCATSFHASAQLGCLEKILLGSSQWVSTECSLTWKRSATPAGRLLFRLVPSMRPTKETEYSLWRTPADATRGAHPCPDKQAGKHSLVTEAKGLWPTPQASVIYPKDGLEPKTRSADDPQVGLADVALWATASLHNDGESPETFRQDRRNADSARGQQLVNQVAHGAMPNGSPERTEKPGGLNPEFVCWLMGFPEGWLD